MMFHTHKGVLKRLWFCNEKFIPRKLTHITPSIKPILYGDEASPPVRFVMITAKLLGVEFNLHHINLFKGENKTEFFKKINPLQKVPALTIDGTTICDSYAIALYLCSRTSYQDLYPSDMILRAKVAQLLFFNATILFPIDSNILSEYFAGKWPADEVKLAEWYNAIDHLEMYLNMNKWLTGDKMRLCDICCATTLSSLGIILPPLDRHIKVKEWMKNLEELPSFEINKRGLRRLEFFINEFSN